MPDVRAAAFALRGAGLIEITQRGHAVTVEPEEVTGPIRLRLVEQIQSETMVS